MSARPVVALLLALVPAAVQAQTRPPSMENSGHSAISRPLYVPDFEIVRPAPGTPINAEADRSMSRGVIVTGAVRNPGKVPLAAETMSVLEALTMAGYVRSDASYEVIVRRAETPDGQPAVALTIDRRELESGAAGSEWLLRDGDRVNVPLAKQFCIQGLVQRPGTYVIDVARTVGQAIVLAGGLTGRGSESRITIERSIGGQTVRIPVKLDDRIEADDIITVGGRRF